MMKRVVMGALMGALAMVTAGCSDECTDRFDCEGNPGAGKVWACLENKCRAQDETVTPPGNTDAGTGDAGTGDAGTGGTDAGTGDAGTGGTDAGTDAGTPPADMSLAEGATCPTNASCMAGLYCDAAKKCAPLHIAVTATRPSAAGSEDALVVPYKKPGESVGTDTPTRVSEDTTGKSRFPRWNKEGTTLAFVNEDTAGTVNLVGRAVPFTGASTTLMTGATAGTVDFRYMEWAPSAVAVWSTKASAASGTVSGIKGVGADGQLKTYTASGVFPAWAADGNSFAYSASGVGLKVYSLSGSDGLLTAVSSTTAEQPQYNRSNSVVLYLDANGQVESGLFDTPLTGLYTPPVAPATTPTAIAVPTTETVSGVEGEVKSYIVGHTWAPGGTHVAYVRVFYVKRSSGEAAICDGQALCASRNGNVVYVRRMSASGVPEGDEVVFAQEATLPAFSPDGRFLAYLSGGKLHVQQINPDATTPDALKVGSLIIHTWSDRRILSNSGDDTRPRWQPR